MTIWIDAEAFVEALNRSSVWGWSTEQDQTAHRWVFGEIEKFLNDNQQPDGDLISRQDAIEAIRKLQTYKLFKKDNMLLVDKAEVMTELMMLPSAPDSRQRGEWEPLTDYIGNEYFECSKCHDAFYVEFGTPEDNNYNFCPNCGARMFKGGEDE